MFCQSISRTLMFLVLLLVNVIAVRAPYAHDTLDKESRDAIERTYALQATLEQDSKTNPANAQANREKISLLGLARAELARVYTSPLSTDGTSYTSGHRALDTTGAEVEVADNSEFAQIRQARRTIAEAIPGSVEGFANTQALSIQLEASRQQRLQVEKDRVTWMRTEPSTSLTKEDAAYIRARDANLKALVGDQSGEKGELTKATQILEETGDATRFIAAQQALRAHQEMYGPLKRVSGVENAVATERARKKFQALADASRILEDVIRKKTAAHEETHLLEAHLEVLQDQLAQAKDAARKTEQLAEEKMRARNLARSERRLGAAAAEGPTLPTTPFTGASSTVEELIAGHKTQLADEIARYQASIANPDADAWRAHYEQQIKVANDALAELQAATERRLHQPGITDENEIKAAKKVEDDRLIAAKRRLDTEGAALQTQRDQAVEGLRNMATQRTAPRELEQAQRELAELTERAQAALATNNADGSPRTEGQMAAAKEDLRRELLARSHFEEQVIAAETQRLMATAEQDARRSAAERLFTEIDASEAASEDFEALATPRTNFLAEFKKLKPAEQLELTTYLEHPESPLPETGDVTKHPFTKFIHAATAYSESVSRPALTEASLAFHDAALASKGSVRTGPSSVGSVSLASWKHGSVSSSLPRSTAGSTRGSVISESGYTTDHSAPSAHYATSLSSVGSEILAASPRPRNIFAEFYTKDYATLQASAREQAGSPLTRARLYKENPEAFTQARQEVDTAVEAAAAADGEETKSDAKKVKNFTMEIQQQKALAGNSRSEQERLQAVRYRNIAELQKYKSKIAAHEKVDEKSVSDEQARQLMVLTKADFYYEAIKETINKLQRQFAEKLQSAQEEFDGLQKRITHHQDAGEAVPEDLLQAHKAAHDRIEAAKNKAADMLTAFKTDPVPFLTARGQRVDLDALGEHLANPAPRDKDHRRTGEEPSEQLTIFREALAARGIDFWREEDVAPEITSALNLLKHPESADENVRALEQPTSRNLGQEIESGEIAAALAKVRKRVDGYTDPAALSLKRAAARKKATEESAANLIAYPETARAVAATRVADYQATGKSELTDKFASKMLDSDPVVTLVILHSEAGEIISHGDKQVFLMTEDEAASEIRQHDSEKLTTVSVKLNLADLTPAGMHHQLRNVLVEQGFSDNNATQWVEAILPTDHPAHLASELAGLQRIKESAVAAVQEQTKALDLLAATRKDPMFQKFIHPDEEEAGSEEDEDTVILKRIKHFDLVKTDYLETINNPDAPAKEIAEAHKRYHQYLSELVDSTETHLKSTGFSRENRTLLLALSTEALRELERPGVRDLNTEDLLDTRAKAQSFALTHMAEIHAEDAERDLETATPSAAAKRAQIEKARRALDEKIRNINKGLTDTSSEEELLAAFAEQRRLRAQFYDEIRPIMDNIQHDLELSAAERIAQLSDKADRLRKELKAAGQSAKPDDNPRLAEIARLIEAEKLVHAKEDSGERAKRKQEKAAAKKAVARRLAGSIAAESAQSGGSIPAHDAHAIASELAAAGKGFKREQRERTAARTSARAATARPLSIRASAA